MNVKSGITIVASSAFVPTKARNCGSRRCRKPQFLLVGVAPQTPFSAPLPGLVARSLAARSVVSASNKMKENAEEKM